MSILYNIIIFIMAIFAFPFYAAKIIFKGKYRRSIGPKFGFVRPGKFARMQGNPRIWLHAVSVGEVTAAAPILSSLRKNFPEGCIVLSTSTESGQDMAGRIVRDASEIFYYPLDFPFIVNKIVDLVRPDVFVMVETELWPNFIRICRQRKIKILMVNGRISPRSFKRYFLTRFFWKGVLEGIDKIGVISETDAARIKAIGIAPEKVHVLGNAKYDSLAAETSWELKEDIARRLNIGEEDRVFIAGSTHQGEEEVVLRTYKNLLNVYPDLKLIIVPRHIERAGSVIALAENCGFTDLISMSEIKKGGKRTNERIVIVDVIGELFKIYSLATVVFCGGSLVPRGGQNILEAAAWGKVVFYGPHMEDFRDEKELLENAGVGFPIQNEQGLFDGVMALMKNPEELKERGARGKDTVIANMGAAKRYAAMISMHVNEG